MATSFGTNGTSQGTHLVKDIKPGSSGCGLTGIYPNNGIAYFSAADADSGLELWQSDGTEAGTTRVRNINAPPANFTVVLQVNPSTPPNTVLNASATISSDATDPLPGNNSASIATTVIQLSADLGIVSADSPDPVLVGNNITYTMTVTNHGPTPAYNVTFNDATPPSTTFFSFAAPPGWSLSAPSVGSTGPVTSSIAFLDIGATAEFTFVVRVRPPTPDNTIIMHNPSVSSATSDPSAANNSVTNTTLARTARADVSVTITDPEFASPGFDASYLITVTNHGPDNATGLQLIVPTPANTTFVSFQAPVGSVVTPPVGGTGQVTVSGFDLGLGDLSSFPFHLTSFNGSLIFRADDGVSGVELWKTSGTPSSTALLKDINPNGGSLGSTAYLEPRNVAGTLFFGANDGVNGNELWKSNGTTAGTILAANIRPGSAGSGPHSFSALGTPYFLANNGTNGSELWQYAGSSANMVRDIWTGMDNGVFESPIVTMNGFLYFVANDGMHGKELWRSDGTFNGTTMVKDVYLGATGSFPTDLTVVNDTTLFFVADDGVNGRELWKSDGTPNGTVLVRDIFAGPDESFISDLTAVGPLLFFAAFDGLNGFELWKSDGSQEGTVMVIDLNLGPDSSGPGDLVDGGGVLYFSAFDPVNGRELRRSNGTEEGTTLVRDINLGPMSGLQGFHPMSYYNGFLYFAADDGNSGFELWTTDGTEAGTRIVRDINPNGDSNPADFTDVNGTIFFTANDGITGVEVWKTDGTTNGTLLVHNVRSANSVTFTMVVHVNPSINPGTVLHETSSVSAFTPVDPVSANNSVDELITVQLPNKAPTLNSLSGFFLQGDAGLQTVNLSGITAGPGESQHLTVTAMSTNPALIANPTVNYNSPDGTGSITFIPTTNQNGSTLIKVTVTDDGGTFNGGVNSITRSFIVTVNSVNDAPVLFDIEDAPLDYTEDQPPTAITAALSVMDVDNTLLTGGTVAITGNFVPGEDQLAFTNQAGITGAYNATTGVLTLSGSASVAAYQTALRAVTYRNLSFTPATAVRTIRFQVTDGSASNALSNFATRTIQITALDDTPHLIRAVFQNNAVFFYYAGLPGRTYTVEYTDSLVPTKWFDFGTFPADNNGEFFFSDDTILPMRFYRVRFP